MFNFFQKFRSLCLLLHILETGTVSHSNEISSVTQSCLTLPSYDCRIPGFPVHHQLPEISQTHVHRVGDAIQPSHPLSPPSPIFNLFQHYGLFKWISSSHQVAKVLEFQLQHQPSNKHPGLISFRMVWLDLLVVQGTLKSLLYPSGSSQCTRPKHPVSCIEPGLAIHFIYDIIDVSMPFSQI